MAEDEKKPNLGGAPVGNTNATKFGTPEARAALCDAACAHIAEGFTLDAFEHCSPPTLRAYARKYPVEFSPLKKAKAKRALKIQKLGWSGASGGVKNFNPTAYIWMTKITAGYGVEGLDPLSWIDALPDPDMPEEEAEEGQEDWARMKNAEVVVTALPAAEVPDLEPGEE